MIRFSHYRTFALASALALTLPACDAAPHKTMQVEQRIKWDLTKIGVLYQLAQQQYQVGDYDKARQTLGQIFATTAPHAPSHILAAKVDLEKGSLEDASSHLKTAVQIDSNNAEAYYMLGVTYQRWQNMQTACDYYQLAWQKKPSEALYLLAVVEMQISMGHYDEANKLLLDKMVYFEQSAAVRAALAKIAVLKGDYEGATRYYRDATLLSPDDTNLRQNYAESLFFTQRFADVIPILEDLRKSDGLADKHSLLTLLGESYLAIHRARDARTIFAEQTRLDAQDNVAWLDLGKATLALEDYNQSASVARRILKAEPKNLQALVLLGLSQQKLGQWDQAQTSLAKAHELDSKDSTVLCLLGLIAQHQGENGQAQKYYTQAVDTNPTNAWAQELLASSRSVNPIPAAIPLPMPAPTLAPTPSATPVEQIETTPAIPLAPAALPIPAPAPAEHVDAPPAVDSTPAPTPVPAESTPVTPPAAEVPAPTAEPTAPIQSVEIMQPAATASDAENQQNPPADHQP